MGSATCFGVNRLSVTESGCYCERVLDDQELPHLEALVATDPGNIEARRQLAEVLLGAGQPGGALVHARILLTATPRDPALLGLAAMAADLSGDPESAIGFGVTLRSVQRGDATAIGAELRAAPAIAPGAVVSLLGLNDIAGMAEERRRIERSLIDPWRAAMRLGSVGAEGVLLYGPPSSGKRFFAHVAAGELALPVVEIDLAAVVDPWGEPDLDAIGAAFAQCASGGPTVLLLANIELATHRRLRYSAKGRKVLTDVLLGLDSLAQSATFVVATSSAPWLIQPVLRRPGRLHDAVLIGPPDRAARRHLLASSIRRRDIANDVDVAGVSGELQGYTTADIESMLDAAVARAYSESVRCGQLLRVESSHLAFAIARGARQANSWFDMAYNFPEFTDDSAQFDPLFDYIRRHVRRA